MIKKYYDSDCDFNLLKGKTISIIGYGSQGHAHALNLKESGLNVCVGLRSTSASWQKAAAAGLEVKEVDDEVEETEVKASVILLPSGEGLGKIFIATVHS